MIELLRKLAHLLVVIVGWVGFVWLWLLVAARPWDSQGLTWLIVGSLILMPLLTGAWVLHNRSLYRRKGERQAVATADMGYAHDWHGRSVQADWAALRRSRSVLIEVEGEHKRYHGSLIDKPARSPMPAHRPAVAQDSLLK
jgi:hypothetical protein